MENYIPLMDINGDGNNQSIKPFRQGILQQGLREVQQGVQGRVCNSIGQESQRTYIIYNKNYT